MLFEKPSAWTRPPHRPGALPPTLPAFILACSGWHQLAAALLAIVVFLLDALPLELQRRIIATAAKGNQFAPISVLLGLYLGVIFAHGLSKLLSNLYVGWIGESATRALRLASEERRRALPAARREEMVQATGISMVVAEADDIGGFVGSSVSAPVLQGGFLITVSAYLAWLHPWLAIAGLAVILPQMIFVPIMQRAINRRVAQRILLLRHVGSMMLTPVAAGASEEAERVVRAEVDGVFCVNIGIFRLKFGMNFLMNLTTSLGIAGVLGLGAWFVVRGDAEVATVVTFLSALGRVIDPWNDLVDWARGLMVSIAKYELLARGFAAVPGTDGQTAAP